MTGDIPAARLPGAVLRAIAKGAGGMSRGIYRATGSIGTRWGGQGAIALLLGILLLLAAGPARAQCVGTTCTVANATDLVSALTTVDNNPGISYVINFTGQYHARRPTTLPAINSASTVTINGNSHTLDGGSVQRGFFVYQGTVAINDLTIQNTVAQGGARRRHRRRGCRPGRRAVRRHRRHLSVSNVTLPATVPRRRGGQRHPSASGAGGGGGMGGNGGRRAQLRRWRRLGWAPTAAASSAP